MTEWLNWTECIPQKSFDFKNVCECLCSCGSELSNKAIYFHSFAMYPAFWQIRQWNPTPVLLPGKSHGQRSLVGCSPWGREESDMTARLHFHVSLLRTGEGNGNPLQCSCLENPRDGGAWWAAVYGVAQSRTRLKRLSSSSSILKYCLWSGLLPFIILVHTQEMGDTLTKKSKAEGKKSF